MRTLGKTVGKKAAKTTARHSVHGFSSKAKRQPVRSVTLLGTGGAVGAVGGWLLGRRAGRRRPNDG
jgi:membrane protein YqaA with SNARE-associated domain